MALGNTCARRLGVFCGKMKILASPSSDIKFNIRLTPYALETEITNCREE